MGTKVSLNGRFVGDNEPVYIIAEGGLTNWGDLELAKKQVDVAMAAGADAIKFQAQTTEALVSKKADLNWFRRMKYKELSHDDLRRLWEYCAIRNIQSFITSHTDVDLEFLDKELDVPFFKIGSGESLNYDFLKNIGARKKPVIMSLGLHLNEEEIKKSISTLEEAGTKNIIIMHCSTVYPTPPDISDLKAIERLKTLTDYPIGYSDHSVGWHLPLASAAMGARIIEKHISFDKSDKRSFDCPGSCEPEDLKEMVAQIRDIETAMREFPEERTQVIKKARTWAQQSIVANADISKGTKIEYNMLAFKRPGKGLPPDKAQDVLGKSAARDIQEDELVLESDVL